jgi:hypothetical protein
MAIMTAGKGAVGEAPWSRAMLKRASARGLKSARGTKSAGGLKSARGTKSAGGLKSGRGLKSARGPKSDRETCRDQRERRCEEAICLARQAGPGPRI